MTASRGPVRTPVANEYSPTWFETFLAPGVSASADREVAFVQTYLPRDRFPRLLDVACGTGRVAGPLADLGYDVLGVDLSEPAVSEARVLHPSATYRQMDMRQLDTLERVFDGVLCLWASFGYGTDDENASMLGGMARRLRPGGRLLLDVYNAGAMSRVSETTRSERAGRVVTTRRELAGSRYRVRLTYSDSTDVDLFDWRVYDPEELVRLGASMGLDTVLRCAWFDGEIAPGPEHQRFQILFGRPHATLPDGSGY